MEWHMLNPMASPTLGSSISKGIPGAFFLHPGIGFGDDMNNNENPKNSGVYSQKNWRTYVSPKEKKRTLEKSGWTQTW